MLLIINIYWIENGVSLHEDKNKNKENGSINFWAHALFFSWNYKEKQIRDVWFELP